MADPVFFTIEGDYKAVVADVIEDLDADPQMGAVSASVTFTPSVQVGDVILALDAAPRPTGYMLAPIVGRIDTDGRVKLRVDPDGNVQTFGSVSAFPTPGEVGDVYIDTSADIPYRWTGSAYVVTVNFTPVRLLADTPLLALDSPLFYTVSFTNVVFNGEPGVIKGFTFQAPTFDTPVNLIKVGRVPGSTSAGISRGPAGPAVWWVPVTGGYQQTDGSATYGPVVAGLTLIDGGGGGGGGTNATNLAVSRISSQVVITSDTGTDATIPAADTANAGVMTATMQNKLAGIAAGADVTGAGNVAAAGAVMTSSKNVANGVAGLDGTGKVGAAQLPSSVDDVQEFANRAAFPGTGTSGVIYLALDTSFSWRWSGTTYLQIISSPGSTDNVAEGTANLYYTQARADARVVAGITGKLDTSAAPELIRDTMGTALVQGSNMALTVSDVGDTITVALAATPSIATLDVGNADTTVTRFEAGLIGVEGVAIPTITGGKRIAVVTVLPGSPDANTLYFIPETPPTRVNTGTFLTGTTTTTAAIPAPASIVVGNVLMAHLTIESTATITPPAGWTEDPNTVACAISGGVHRLHIFTKIAAAADVGAGTYTFTWTGSVYRTGFIDQYTNVDTLNPLESSVGATNVALSTTSPAVSLPSGTLGTNRLVVWHGTNYAGGAWSASPSGFTEHLDSDGQVAATRSQVAAGGVTGALTGTTTNGPLTAWLGVLRPA